MPLRPQLSCWAAKIRPTNPIYPIRSGMLRSCLSFLNFPRLFSLLFPSSLSFHPVYSTAHPSFYRGPLPPSNVLSSSPVYSNLPSFCKPTNARKTILKSGIRCLAEGVWSDCNIGGIWLWGNRDSLSSFLFLLLSFDFTTFAFILFGSFLPWGTLGFDTGLINFSLSFCFFDVPRILSLIGSLCFGG